MNNEKQSASRHPDLPGGDLGRPSYHSRYEDVRAHVVSGDIHGYFVQDKVRPHPSKAKSSAGSRSAEHTSPSIFDAKSLRILTTAIHRHNNLNKVNVSWRRLLRFVTTDRPLYTLQDQAGATQVCVSLST